MHLPKVNTKLLAIKAHFFLLYGGVNAMSPFMTTMAKERGYSGFLIGIVIFVMASVAVFSRPVFGAITDRYRNQKTVLVYMIVVTAVVTSFYRVLPDPPVDVDNGDDTAALLTYQFWLFFVFLLARYVTKGGLVTLSETICLQNLGKDSHKFGEQRLWGTLGWGMATLTSGWLIDWYSYGKQTKDYTPAMVLWIFFLLADLLVCTLQLQDCQSEVVPKHMFNDMKKIVSDVKVLSFFFWIALLGIYLGSTSLYLTWHMDELVTKYHPERRSSIKTIQGAMILVKSIGSEVPFFYLSGKIIKKIGHTNSMLVGLCSLSVRFFLYYIITDPLWVLPVELLAGLGYALPFSAMLAYGSSITPDGLKGTVQGLISSIYLGIGLGFGSVITGSLFGRIGSSETYLVLGISVLVVCFIKTVTTIVLKMTKSKTEENGDDINAVHPSVQTNS